MYTIRHYKKDFSGLTVAIVGDVLHSRVARSQIHALKTLGVPDLRVIGPKTLLPAAIERLGVRQFQDMHLHHDFDRARDSVLALLARVRRDVAVYAVPDYNRFPNQFSHIFAGGYAAGYYSYKWAEVLSADAFGAFEEAGVLNPEVGERFLREVLGAGGSRPALESFVAFRGRKPQIDALLRHNGMTTTA